MSGDGLNRAQRTAVTTLSGPLLVLAGAGTGKTRVITFRIAELIKAGISPHRILAVTFTNKAAREMRTRAMALLGKRKKRRKGPEISTFHSLCVRILRRHAQRLGYPDNFSIYDRGDQESIARAALRDIRVGSQKLRPSDLIHQISAWKGDGIAPEEARTRARRDVDLLAAEAYAKYQASLRVSGAMDFDDLLAQTERLFLEHPEARFAEASRFDHLLIDEYQDTSGLQYRIVRALAERHRNICVVGDDDQSIYGWRGAEVEHILAFNEQWPDAKVVRLEENYRSTGWVLRLANTLIAHNTVRHDKVLKPAREQGPPPRFLPFDDENLEAETIVSEIFHKVNATGYERVPASNIAILFRTNEQPRAFEQEMRRAGVPYRIVGGQSFYDRKEIKDLLSYLKVVANPADEVSLLRVINTPPRGIGAASVQTLLDEAVAAGKPLWELLPAAEVHPEVSPAAAQAIEQFRATMDEFRARLTEGSLSDLVGELIVRVNYKAEIERAYKDSSEQETRWNAVQELVNAVATYEERDDNPSLLGFLEESTLSDREDDRDEDGKQEHAVTLMTLHSAKGLEFPEVYLVGMEEGLLPHKRSLLEGSSIPEERRLAYVGVTRAQDLLTLSFCKNRMKWGKLRPQIPSRFLLEMRGDSEKAKAVAAEAEERFARELERAETAEAEKIKKQEKKAKTKKRRPKATPEGEAPGKVAQSPSGATKAVEKSPVGRASTHASEVSSPKKTAAMRAAKPAKPEKPVTGTRKVPAAERPAEESVTGTREVLAAERPAQKPKGPRTAREDTPPVVAPPVESAPPPPHPPPPHPVLLRARQDSSQPSDTKPAASSSAVRKTSSDYRQVSLFGD